VFDAGAIQAHLDIDLGTFDKKMTAAEQRVKRFEAAKHEIKISAVFDDASTGHARQMFAQLDNQLSRDAMQRLRSSPQGSVLGALTALLSPHGIVGAPSISQIASGGTLGRAVSGGGNGNAGLGSVLLNQAAPGSANASRAATAAASAAISADKAATATEEAARETAQAARDTSQTSRSMLATIRNAFGVGGGAVSRVSGAGSLRALFSGGGGAGADLAAAAVGGAGGGARGFAGLTGHIGPLSGGIIGGIGPGVGGISPLMASLVAGGGILAGALPAATAGLAGLGVAGGGAALLISQNKQVQASAKSMLSDLTKTVTAAAAPLIKPLLDVFGQIPKFVTSIAPTLKQLFAASAPALTLFVSGLELLVKNMLPGLLALLKAGTPAFKALSDILSTFGRDLGTMFRDFASVVGPSSVIFKALFDTISALLPLIGQLGVIFATALAPVIGQFATALRALMPTLTIIGRVIASLAAAVLADLASALTALAQLLVNISPALSKFADAFDHIFTVLENNGIFATVGNVLESLAAPLGKLISLLLNQLTPLLPVLIVLVSKLSTILLDLLAAGLATIITGITALLTKLPFLTPLIAGLTLAWLAWNLVMDANPIGAIILVIVALVGAITLLATHWHEVWTDIKNWAMDAWNFLTHGWGQFLIPGLTGIRLAVEFVRDNWREAWTDMKNWTDDFWGWLHQVFGVDVGNFFMVTIPGWFDSAVQGIGQFWDNIENTVKAPVKFVIDDVLDGLISVFDDITSAVGLGRPISVVHPMGLAAGGLISAGTGPVADDVLIRASRGETVVSAADSKVLAPWFAAMGIPGYQLGGVVSGLKRVGQGAVNIGKDIGSGIVSIGGKALDLGKMAVAFATGNEAAFTNAFASMLGLGNGGAAGLLGQILVSAPKAIAKDLVNWIMGKSSALGASGSAIADYAMTWLGKIPYVWGGTAVPGGADCSGFVEAIYEHFGIHAPRTSEAQGSWVTKGGPTPGGLAFYHSPAGGPDPGHVAIVRSAQQVISQGGGMGPQLIPINALPLLFTGVPPGGLGKGGGGAATAGSMSPSAISSLWSSLGGPGWAAANMARIAMAESGDVPGIIQQGEPPGLTGWGLYQITPTSGITQNGAFGNLLNAANNTRAAISLFSASGYSPWASDPVGAGLSAAPFGYANGGVIKEPIIGFGASGQTYTFGENGREYVSPAGPGGGPAGGAMIGNVSIQLPEGQTVARALAELSFWLKVAQQQGYAGVLPGG
jgi:NlpC/P60 family